VVTSFYHGEKNHYGFFTQVSNLILQSTKQIELFEESEDDEEPEKPKGENIMLRPYFRANFKAGYWEAVFFHTKPLGVVPADMRAR